MLCCAVLCSAVCVCACVRARARACVRVSVRSRLQPCAFDLRPHAREQVELWCQLAGWGLVRVGMVPVPYDAHSRCTFPEISEAELHSAELRFAPAALPAAPQHGQRSGHAVSLAIKDEGHVLAVAEQMLARHIPGLA